MRILPHRTLPVLMYHRFGPRPTGDPDLWIAPDRLQQQLEWLAANRYRTLTLGEAHTALAAGRVPARTVLLTIDDGFADDLLQVTPVLQSAAARAALFVPTALLGRNVDMARTVELDPSGATPTTSAGRLIDTKGLQLWLAAGFDVGSHGRNHLDLTAVDRTTLEREVSDSKAQLETLLGQTIPDFCYPYACHDRRVRDAVASAGYRAAYAGEPPCDHLYAIPRMMIYPGDDLARFRRKVSGYYFWISAWHQKLRRFVRN